MNHKITSLSVQKRNPQRVNVYLDGEFAFGLERIVAAWLQVGQEISDEKIAQLKAEETQEMAYQKALNLLSYRPRSEAEIRKNLQGHSVSDENIEYAVDRLKRSGLLNDNQFARAWVENRNEMRPRSRRALAYELQQRGVDRQVIDQELGSIDDEQLEYQAASQRARKLKELEWQEFRQKMYRFLAQRGFDYEAINQVTSRVWAEMHDTDSLADEGA